MFNYFVRPINLIIALIVLYFVYQKFVNHQPIEDKTKNCYLTQWIHQGFGYGYGEMSPGKRLPDLIKEFGFPDYFDPKSGGGAVWKKESLKDTPYHRIEIRDEQIPHDKPKKHVDFLYSWYGVEVPPQKIGGLHKISKSISYDPLKKMMRARCHDMRPNVVTHWIVKKYAKGDITIDEAVGMYGPMIIELFQDDQGGVKYRQLESEL